MPGTVFVIKAFEEGDKKEIIVTVDIKDYE